MQNEAFNLCFNRNRIVDNVYLWAELSSCCECYLSKFNSAYLDLHFLASFVKD
jgi:hypothetical protein